MNIYTLSVEYFIEMSLYMKFKYNRIMRCNKKSTEISNITSIN